MSSLKATKLILKGNENRTSKFSSDEIKSKIIYNKNIIMSIRHEIDNFVLKLTNTDNPEKIQIQYDKYRKREINNFRIACIDIHEYMLMLYKKLYFKLNPDIRKDSILSFHDIVEIGLNKYYIEDGVLTHWSNIESTDISLVEKLINTDFIIMFQDMRNMNAHMKDCELELENMVSYPLLDNYKTNLKSDPKSNEIQYKFKYRRQELEDGFKYLITLIHNIDLILNNKIQIRDKIKRKTPVSFNDIC